MFFSYRGNAASLARKPSTLRGVWELGSIPLSAAFSMMADEVVRNVKELMAKKDSIEKEIKELHDVLDSVSIQRVS